MLSYAVAPIVVVYLCGWFWSRATTSGALAALVAGVATAVLIGILQYTGHFTTHYLHVPLPVATVSLVTMIVVSLMSKRHVRPEDRLLVRDTASLNSRDGLIAIALTLLVGLQVIAFW